MTTAGHLASEEVAAYLDKALSEAECARVESHLADCDACREEIVSVSRLLEPVPRSKRRAFALSTIAAAAVLAVFVGRTVIDSEFSAERLRGRDAPFAFEGVTRVRAVAPIGRHSAGSGIVFVWRAASPGTVYRFTLTDDGGETIWAGSTNDTTLVDPGAAGMSKGRSYHWYVDAVQPDGSSATTGVTSFQVAP